MKINNKGMTLVELIVSIALISIVMGFLFKVILDVRYEKNNSGYASANQVNRAEFIKTVQDDLLELKFEDLIDLNENDNKITLNYRNGKSGDIILDSSKTISYVKDGIKKTWDLEEEGYEFQNINYDVYDSCYVKIIIPVLSKAEDDQNIDDIEILAKYYNCPYEEPEYLNTTVINNYGGKDNIEELDISVFFNAASEADTGLYKTQDDYGTSYYLRGNILNNHVKFGKNSEGNDLYWRIIRINGDGSIRLFYQGTYPKGNEYSSYGPTEFTDSTITHTQYNFDYSSSASDGYKYVGYTYDEDGNQVDSIVKMVVEDWYEYNLKDKYGQYLADVLFCNDRTEDDDHKYDNIDVYYATQERISLRLPTLKCNLKNDRYTVNDKNIGNGYLKYPIALITADEAIMTGAGVGKASDPYHLLSSGTWTMTPARSNSYANMWIFGHAGSLSYTYPEANIPAYYVYNNMSVQPVINLKFNVKVSAGDGTIDSPYEITF